jgi:hypothetical protein
LRRKGRGRRKRRRDGFGKGNVTLRVDNEGVIYPIWFLRLEFETLASSIVQYIARTGSVHLSL